MGDYGAFEPATLFVGLLFPASSPEVPEEAWTRLSERWGAEGYRSSDIPFHWSHYYDQEMGAPLIRSLRAFRDFVPPDSLADAKHFTNDVERELSREGHRRVNLDPGLLFPSRLILATTKDRSHRIPLRDGIYGELTLLYEDHGWKPLPWTYADYRSPLYAAALSEIRILHKEQRKRMR